MFFLMFLLPLLASCARPLTQAETRFAETLLGSSLNTGSVSIVNGALIGNITHRRPTRPRVACRERIWPAPKTKTVEVGTAAFVLFDAIFISRELYQRDFLQSYPAKMDLPYAMLFAHEMTHVWQWQNRDITGYHPFKAAREHRPGTDPYLLDIDTSAKFLDYPFEQQAAIVEEYVCCSALDPQGSRTQRLRDMLAVNLPVADLDAALADTDVFVPWKDAKIRGICS